MFPLCSFKAMAGFFISCLIILVAVMFISTVYCCFGVRLFLICALICTNEFWTVQIYCIRKQFIKTVHSVTDIFLSSFLLLCPTFPGFPGPSADHFQKDRAVPAEQHPGGRLHHRHRLSVCIHQYCKWLLGD